MLKELIEKSYLLRMMLLLTSLDRFRVIPLLGLAVLRGVLPTIDLWIIAQLVDALVSWEGNLLSTFGFWLSTLIGLRIVGEVISLGMSYIGVKIRDRVDIHLKRTLFAHINEIGLLERESSIYADRVSRANSATNPTRITILLESVPKTISEFAGMISLMVLLFSIFWLIPVLNIVLLSLCIFAQAKASVVFFSQFYSQTQEQRLLETYEHALFSKDQAGEVRFFGFGKWLLAKWERLFVTFSKQRRKTVNKQARTGRISEWVMISFLPTTSALVLIFGVQEVTAGSVIIALQSTQHLSSKLYFILNQFQSFVESRQMLKEFFSFLDEVPQDGNSVEPLVAKGLSIQCSNMGFTYPNQKESVLEDINLNIAPGEHIAIVGENGSGKSTLVKLLMGLYLPTEGQVTLSSNNKTGTCANNNYRISALFQDYVKYNYKLRENIGFGDYRFIDDQQRLSAAARKSECLEIVNEAGLDIQIGREFEGIEFSEGEWQRIALSRTLFREECGLITLDEPTAALDAISEAKILKGFLQVDRERTCLFVSHRLASIRLADRILVLKEGRIVEQGSHQELMENCGEYSRLFNTQVSAYS